MKYIPSILLTLFITAAAHAACDCPEAEPRAPGTEEAMAGQGLSAEEAGKLESAVAKHPDDLSARTRLLGYYYMRQYSSPRAAKARRRHILWIIAHRPEAEISGVPYSWIDPTLDKGGYNQAKRLWLKQAQSHSESAPVLGHAAKFFVLRDKDLSEKLFGQAQKLEPENPKWADELGRLYAVEGGTDKAAKSLAEYELAQAADNSESGRFARLDNLAASAFDAGDMEKAFRYATDSLDESAKYRRNWNYGNAIHHSNNVLGRIALKQGDIKLADEFLLKAGATPGSPQLESFGPNMALAKELLKKGEKETVLRYIDLCRDFWKMGGAELDDWSKGVKEDRIPDFGANLAY